MLPGVGEKANPLSRPHWRRIQLHNACPPALSLRSCVSAGLGHRKVSALRAFKHNLPVS